MKRIVGIVGLLLLAPFAWGQGQTYSLKEAQQYAVQHNADVMNARADLAIAEKQVTETRAIGLPQVSGEVQFQNFIDIPTTLIPAQAFDQNAPADLFTPVQFGTEYNTTASITASQLIFDGSYLVGLQAIKQLRELQTTNVKRNELEVQDAVAKAYYTGMVARENVRVMESMLENMNKILTETEAIYKEGLLEEMDVDQLRLTVANITNRLNMAKRQEEVALQVLKLQMGLDIKTEISLSEELETTVESVDGAALLSQEFSASSNPDFMLLESQQSLQELNMKNEKADFMPTLAAFFTHQQMNMGNELKLGDGDAWFPSTLWGLNLSVPIFSSGMRSAQVSQAKLELEKATNTLNQVGQALEMQASTARANWQTAKEVYDTEVANLDLAERIQQRTLVKYQEGLASSMDLSQAQNQYLTTQGNYVKAMLDLLNAKAEIDKVYNNY